MHYSPPDKNRMASRFVPVTEEQIFVPNEAVVSHKVSVYQCVEEFFKVVSNE
jgi:hypothetical protein